MSACSQEVIIRRAPPISLAEVKAIAERDSTLQWRDTCDLRPDACETHAEILPTGYLVRVGHGTHGLTIAYDAGALSVASADDESVEFMRRLADGMNASVVVSACADESVGWGVAVASIAVVLLIVAGWIAARQRFGRARQSRAIENSDTNE